MLFLKWIGVNYYVFWQYLKPSQEEYSIGGLCSCFTFFLISVELMPLMGNGHVRQTASGTEQEKIEEKC